MEPGFKTCWIRGQELLDLGLQLVGWQLVLAGLDLSLLVPGSEPHGTRVGALLDPGSCLTGPGSGLQDAI